MNVHFMSPYDYSRMYDQFIEDSVKQIEVVCASVSYNNSTAEKIIQILVQLKPDLLSLSQCEYIENKLSKVELALTGKISFCYKEIKLTIKKLNGKVVNYSSYITNDNIKIDQIEKIIILINATKELIVKRKDALTGEVLEAKKTFAIDGFAKEGILLSHFHRVYKPVVKMGKILKDKEQNFSSTSSKDFEKGFIKVHQPIDQVIKQAPKVNSSRKIDSSPFDTRIVKPNTLPETYTAQNHRQTLKPLESTNIQNGTSSTSTNSSQNIFQNTPKKHKVENYKDPILSHNEIWSEFHAAIQNDKKNDDVTFSTLKNFFEKSKLTSLDTATRHKIFEPYLCDIVKKIESSDREDFIELGIPLVSLLTCYLEDTRTQNWIALEQLALKIEAAYSAIYYKKESLIDKINAFKAFFESTELKSLDTATRYLCFEGHLSGTHKALGNLESEATFQFGAELLHLISSYLEGGHHSNHTVDNNLTLSSMNSVSLNANKPVDSSVEVDDEDLEAALRFSLMS